MRIEYAAQTQKILKENTDLLVEYIINLERKVVATLSKA
jgi:hypothetical protein